MCRGNPQGIALFSLGLILLAAGAQYAAAQAFNQCGTLVLGAECTLLETSDGSRYILENIAPFTVGDPVRVVGTLDPDCVSFCMEGRGCIRANTIEFCAGSFEACGTLRSATECIVFEAENGRRFFLDNLGGFQAGDAVHVSGTLDPNCVTTCIAQDGCIKNNQINAATEKTCGTSPITIICPGASAALLAVSVAGLLRFRRA